MFPYTPSIPSAPNDPADDQPLMQQNFASIQNLIAVDHVPFNNAIGGQHTHVTFSGFNPPVADFVSPTSGLFTNVGVAATDPELYYENFNNTFLLSCVKAFGVFDTVESGSATFSNSYNCNSIATTLAGTSSTFLITFATNAVAGTNFIVLLTPKYAMPIPGTAVQISYGISGDNQVSIKTGGAGNGLISQVSFVILQA
jgi:hypothetical protein